MARLRKPSIVIVAVIILAIGVVSMLFILQHRQNEQVSVKPSFETILPDGKTNEQITDWKMVSPENSDPAYAYSDTIDGVPIIVTQQLIPDSFSDNTPEKVEEMAKKFNATSELQTSDSQKFYIGTSAKGPQSVIFTKENLLILIKSDKNIAESSWKTYISSLR